MSSSLRNEIREGSWTLLFPANSPASFTMKHLRVEEKFFKLLFTLEFIIIRHSFLPFCLPIDFMQPNPGVNTPSEFFFDWVPHFFQPLNVGLIFSLQVFLAHLLYSCLRYSLLYGSHYCTVHEPGKGLEIKGTHRDIGHL